MREIKGKVALVTGSSRGIGRQIAKAFASENYTVIINCVNNTEKLQSAFNEIRKINENVFMLQGDVSDYCDVRRMFDAIFAKYNRIDVLVNNAGVSHVGLFNEMKPHEWERVMRTNLNGVYNCTHNALKSMIREKSGSIINISSVWGNVGASCEAVYSASKGAVNSFTKAMAKELAPSGIRVNAISCGVIETEMNDWLSDEERNLLIDSIPLKRFGKAEEVAELALFLASEKAGYITGQIITIDGAYT